MASKKWRTAVQKIVDRKENTVPYLGLNLQTSRSPSVIDSHCRNSYMSATRKLQASRAKEKVRFYVAGENSNCAIYAVSPQRFSTFDQLLAGLIKSPICRGTQGKKYIFNLQTSHKITALEELNPVETYVCATYEVFDQLDKSARTPSPVQKVRTSNKLQPTAAAIVASRQLGTSQSTRNHLQTQTPTIEESEECLFIKEIKPKLITVLKCGSRPRRSVRILLNKKNVRTFEQVVKGISEILSPDDPIRRIYGSSTGKLVMCIADFFLSDKIFISFGNEKMNPEDLVLDRSEVRTVGAYRFKHASAYGRVTLNSHQSAPVGMRPKTIATQSANTSQYLPSRQSTRQGRAQSCLPGIPARPSPVPFSVNKPYEQTFLEPRSTPSRSVPDTHSSTNEPVAPVEQPRPISNSQPTSPYHSTMKKIESNSTIHSEPPSPRVEPSRSALTPKSAAHGKLAESISSEYSQSRPEETHSGVGRADSAESVQSEDEQHATAAPDDDIFVQPSPIPSEREHTPTPEPVSDPTPVPAHSPAPVDRTPTPEEHVSEPSHQPAEDLDEKTRYELEGSSRQVSSSRLSSASLHKSRDSVSEYQSVQSRKKSTEYANDDPPHREEPEKKALSPYETLGGTEEAQSTRADISTLPLDSSHHEKLSNGEKDNGEDTPLV